MRIRKRFWHRLGGIVLAVALLATLTLPASALDTGGTPFVPAWKTPYAKEFIEKCGEQQWFMDMVERALNPSGRSINTLQSKNDLDIVTTLATNSPTDGNLPPAIGEFAQLRYLFLGGIGLNGEIPGGLYDCANLENLDLSGNSLTGGISSDVAKLTKLKVLLLHGNKIEGSIPAFPATLTNLDLSDNALTDGIPDSIGTLTNLTVLGLSNNLLGGQIPASLNTLTALRILTAWNCDFEGTIPNELGSLSNLQILDLSQNELTGTIPTTFSSLNKLEQLALSGNKFSGKLPIVLAGMTKLKTLVLDSNKFSGEMTDIWGGLTNLKIAYLSCNQFIGDIPATLVDLQADDANVHIEQNYLHGENTAKIVCNEGNFTNEDTSGYQVKLSLNEYTQSRKNTRFNVYDAFTVKRDDTGDMEDKPKLPPASYEVEIKSTLSNPAEYFEITRDQNGIYIELLKDIPYADAIEFVLYMQPSYDPDAPYTYTTFKLGTAAPPPGSSSGGGGGTAAEPSPTPEPTPTPEDGKVVRHAPYITGLPGSRVAPDAPLTREQAAVILYRILGEQYAKYDGIYPDVDENRWSAAAIAYVSAQGIMQGYSDGTFRPAGNITRAEFAAVLVRMKSYGQSETAAFTDAIGHWANGYIGAASDNGLMNGYPDGSFKPNGHITRAEAMTAINRMLGRVPDAEAIAKYTNPYIDLSPTHWAYAQIIEATVEHDAVYENGVEAWE
jgi:Leucine-rich repeat (LRR) protein